MATRFSRLGLLGAFAVGLAAFACESGGVGDPCIPDEEYSTRVGGFDQDQVVTEARSFQCATRLCLVNKFQGRVSCPYGSDPADVARFADLYATDKTAAVNFALGNDGEVPRLCTIPGSDGTNADDYVREAVEPQYSNRSPADAVYCSTRCANAEGRIDDGPVYEECPSGFSCLKLVDDLGKGDRQLTGSFCVRDGTQNVVPGAQCSTKEGLECENGQYL